MRWNGPDPIEPEIKGWDWPRIVVRFAFAILLTVTFMVPILIARIFRLYHFQKKLTQLGSQIMLALLGLRLDRDGRASAQASVYVANHSSWMDIFVLFAAAPAQFIAKQEVSKWPGIGFLGQLVGTIFIERNRSKAAEHITLLQDRLRKGERLLFFPEGTSTDGQRILPYRSTLFGAFTGGDDDQDVFLQAVYVHYQPDPAYDPSVYGLWGPSKFSKRMLIVMSLAKRGAVKVRFGPVRSNRAYASRKELAAILEADTRALADPQISSRSA